MFLTFPPSKVVTSFPRTSIKDHCFTIGVVRLFYIARGFAPIPGEKSCLNQPRGLHLDEASGAEKKIAVKLVGISVVGN